MGNKRIWSASLTALAAGAMVNAFAGEESTSSNELESIVVTAQKRAESEQNVPLSMTTFSSVRSELDGAHSIG